MTAERAMITVVKTPLPTVTHHIEEQAVEMVEHWMLPLRSFRRLLR